MYQPPHRRAAEGGSAPHADLPKNDNPTSERPTHFLAVPLTDESSVAEALHVVHASLVSHDSRLQRACAPACTAHITLGVLHLPSDECLQTAISAISSLGSRVGNAAADSEPFDTARPSDTADLNCNKASKAELLPVPFDLSFSGLNTFGKGKVLYMELVSNSGLLQLKKLAALAALVMQASGVPVMQSERSFSPHLTVAKLSHLAGNARSIRRITQESYAAHADITAGPVPIKEVQLCAMGDRPSGAYYRIMTSLPLGNEGTASS